MKMVIQDNIPWEVEGKYDVVLLSPPFLFPPPPSIALSLFRSRLSEAGISSKVLYPGFYMSHLLGHLLSVTLSHYPQIVGVTEFSFAHMTDVDYPFSVDDYVKGMFFEEHEKEREEVRQVALAEREAAEKCVERTAQIIVNTGAGVLAGSSIYSQQNATFAIFKRVKELNPSIKTIMGGTNVRDRAGMAVLRHYKSVDYVFFGEGDEVFDVVCRKLLDGDENDMPYGVIRRGENLTVPPVRLTKDMNTVSYPDYSDYIEEWDREQNGYYGKSIIYKEPLDENSGKGDHIIYAEGSRGCWWGEKNCCTFCGLNGDKNVYRAKSPERLHEELKYLTRKFPGHLLQLTDNILSMDVLHRLLPELAKDEEKYRLVGEVKTNIREEDIRNLVRAGFSEVQPGIESLNDHMLKLLNKGNTAVNHVAFLKYAKTHGLSLYWNLLYAVPGETAQDYEELFELIPKLYHFKAPLGPWEILFQRFSKYEQDPEKYGLELAPFHVYKYYYGDNPDRTDNMYLYYELTGGEFKEVKHRHENYYERLRKMVREWSALSGSDAFHGLTMTDYGDEIFIMDNRPCMTGPFHVLTGAAGRIYRLAWDPVTEEKLYAELSEEYGREEISEAVQMLLDNKLMIFLTGRYLALAVPEKA